MREALNGVDKRVLAVPHATTTTLGRRAKDAVQLI